MTVVGATLATLAEGSLLGQVQSQSPAATAPPQPDKPPVQHFAWGSGRRLGSDRGRERLAQMRAAGVTGLLLNGGNITELAPIARKEGIELHRWRWVLNRGWDRKLRRQHPQWYAVSREGKSCADHPPYVGHYRWLCPSREPVYEFLRDELVATAGIDGLAGVHFDYIRYPDVILPVALQPRYGLVQDREFPEYDYCYCEVCRAKFQQQGGEDPLKMQDPTQNKAWRQYRYDSVTRLVNRLVDAIHQAQPGVKVTAAVFPTPDIARKLVRQDWPKWRLDAVMPMMYHRYYKKDVTSIGPWTREGVEALPADRPLYSGLFVPSLQPPELAHATELALENGARGVCLFTYNAMTKEHWRRLSEVTKEA